jgi:hypothetical protein
MRFRGNASGSKAMSRARMKTRGVEALAEVDRRREAASGVMT